MSGVRHDCGRRLTLAVVFTASWIWVAGVSPRAHPQGLRSPEFRSGVDLVTLHVTVTDPRRHYVTDLNSGEFRVFENGRPQEVTFFQRAGLPLALTLILDTSGSMRTALPAIKNAAVDFVSRLAPGDIASVIAFDTHVTVLQDFTAEPAALAAAIRGAENGSSTSLFTAIYVALKEFERVSRKGNGGIARRRVIVLLSDGDDNASLMRFEDLLDVVTRSDAAIYAIRLGRPPLQLSKPDTTAFVLRHLSEQTGGRAFFPTSEWKLQAVHGRIRAELASQYALAYVSTDRTRSGGFRQLAVLINRPGAVARTRRGYVAAGR